MFWIRTAWRLGRPVFMCCAALLLSCCNGDTGNQPSAKPPVPDKSAIDILEAVQRQKLRFGVRGDRSNIVTLELNVLSSELLLINLEPGYVAKNVEFGVSHDKLIVESPTYRLEPGRQCEKEVRTYSTSYLPQPPADKAVKFQLVKGGRDDLLTQVAAYIVKNPDLEEKIATIAVWAAAEKMSFAQLKDLRGADSDEPYLTGRDYYESMEVLRKAGVRVGHLKFSFDVEDVVLKCAEQLGEADRDDSLKVIEFLGWFYKLPRAGEVLVNVLEEDDDPVLREKAAETLARCDLDSVRESLFLTLELDRVKAVRRTAAFSLLMLGDAGAVPVAIMFLGNEETTEPDAARVYQKLGELVGEGTRDWEAKDWELWWLTRGGWSWIESRGVDVQRVKKAMKAQHRFYGDPGSEAAAVTETENAEVILGWLRKLHTSEGRKLLADPAIFDRVLRMGMDTSNASVALNVAWILRATEKRERMDKSGRVLLEMLSKKENGPAYRDIISVLAQWRVKEAVEPLLYLIDDKQYGEFAEAALKRITGKDVPLGSREEWKKLLAKQGGKVKLEFVKRLNESNGKELTQVLSDLGSSRYRKLWSDPQLYEALLKVSERVRAWEQINPFILILTTNKKDPRTQRTLRRMFDAVEDFEVKRALITALEQHFPNGDTVEFLLGLLDGKDNRLKMAARSALYEVTGATSPKRLKSRSDWLGYFSKHPAARWGKREK